MLFEALVCVCAARAFAMALGLASKRSHQEERGEAGAVRWGENPMVMEYHAVARAANATDSQSGLMKGCHQ
jgi:hypothetical protein